MMAILILFGLFILFLILVATAPSAEENRRWHEAKMKKEREEFHNRYPYNWIRSLNESTRKLQEADEKKKQEQRGLIQQEYDSFKGRKYIDL